MCASAIALDTRPDGFYLEILNLTAWLRLSSLGHPLALHRKKEPPLPSPLLHKCVEEREMERCATGSWVQCANGFGEISPRLLSGSPRTRGERKAQRIGHHKYIGGAYKILGRLGKATLPFPGPPSLRVRERILAPEKRERGHRGGARRPPRGGNGGSIWFNLAQLGSGFGGSRLSGAASGPYLRTDAKDLTDALLFLLAWTSGSWLSQERRSWASSPFWRRRLSC